jgi:hypothetical protein
VCDLCFLVVTDRLFAPPSHSCTMLHSPHQVDAAGEYQFKLYSDDASNLYIDDKLVVDQDYKAEANDMVSNATTLSTGFYHMKVNYMELSGYQALRVSYKGPDTGNIWAPLQAWLPPSGCVCNAGFTGSRDAVGTPCHACVAGKYKDTNGSMPCTPCVAGTFSAALNATADSTCEPCKPGKYTDQHAATACAECTGGKFANVSMRTVCYACPANSNSVAGSNAIANCSCNLGYWGPDGGTCIQCVAGKYKPVAGSHVCSSCKAGTYSAVVGATANSTCKPCPANSNSTTASAACVCIPGWGAWSEISAVHGAIVPGSFEINSGGHVEIPDGVGWHGPGSLSFEFECTSQVSVDFRASIIAPTGDDDSFRILVDQNLPMDWHAGQTSTWGWSSVSPATSVSAGAHTVSLLCKEDGIKIQSLRINTDSSVCFFQCSQCPAGMYADMDGAMAICKSCPAGTFSAAVGANASTTCEACPTNSNSPAASTASTACVCDAGSWGPDGGDCVPCVAGKYKAVNGSEACIACPAGTFARTSGTANCTNTTVQPDQCKPGWGYAVKTRVCIDGIPDNRPTSPCGLLLLREKSRAFQINSWNVGCLHASGSSDVTSCESRCDSPQGCCGYDGILMPPLGSAYCQGNSCSGGSCCDASRTMCKLACTAYFEPAPTFLEELTGAIADDGFCSPLPSECPPGYTHDPAGSWPDGSCKACVEGKYKAVNGSAACVDCPAGTYSSTCAATNCTNMTVQPCECVEGGFAVKTRVCIDGVPEKSQICWPGTTSPIKQGNRLFQELSWRTGCFHASGSDDVTSCEGKCSSPAGCCGYLGIVMPPLTGTEKTCYGNSCSGGGCCDASRTICELACAAYFEPAPTSSGVLTGAIADDGFCWLSGHGSCPPPGTCLATIEHPQPEFSDYFYVSSVTMSPDGLTTLNAGIESWNNKKHTIRQGSIMSAGYSTLAGDDAGFQDGVGSDARFCDPVSTALSPDGQSLLIVDSGNHAMRHLDLSTSSVTTLAGQPTISGFEDGSPGLFRDPTDIAFSQDG